MAKRATSAATSEERFFFDCKSCGKYDDAFEGTARFDQQLCRACYGKRADKRPRDLNDLSGKEWAQLSRSVEQYPDIRSDKQREHGAAFPISLARDHIRMFTKADGLVFDPFAGVGSTLDAAILEGRRAVGTELNERFVELAQHDLDRAGARASLHHDDAANAAKYIEPNSVDLLFTSPPYSDLLKTIKGSFAYKWKEHSKLGSISNPPAYSNHVQDVGNLPYDDYLEKIVELMKGFAPLLKPRGYSCWVVKDFRDMKRKIPYVNLHGDIIECAQAAGYQLWDIRIVDQTKFRPLVCLGYPSSNYYLNIGHSYVLIFRNV